MADNFADFARRMRDLGRRVEQGAARAQRVCALAIDQALVVSTPVDTGRARSNWQVGTGSGVTSTVEASPPGSKGSTSADNTAAAIAQAQAAVAGHRPGQDIHITNNLAYIGALNNGHSPQAAPGFVEAAITEGAVAVASLRVLDRGH